MKSEDMKIKKYEMLIRDINMYFNNTYQNYDRSYSLLDYFIDRDEKNVWLEAIFNAYPLDTNKNTYFCHAGSFSSDKNDTMRCINTLRACIDCTNFIHCSCKKQGYYPNWVLFWLIFIVSVDNENYNNNLSVVADVAYLLEFSEEELADWIAAVKGVLAGKKLSELEYKTEKGQKWFKK